MEHTGPCSAIDYHSLVECCSHGRCWEELAETVYQDISHRTGGQWNVIKFTLWETSHAPSVRSCLYVNLINNSRFWLNKTLNLWKYFTRLDLHYNWRCWFLIQKFGWNSVSFAGDMIWVWPGRRGMVAANCCNISWYQLVITVGRHVSWPLTRLKQTFFFLNHITHLM